MKYDSKAMLRAGLAAVALGWASGAQAVPVFWESNFGTLIASPAGGSDDELYLRTLNAAFPIFGTSLNQVVIGANGFVALQNNIGGGFGSFGAFANQSVQMFGGTPAVPVIAVRWNDLDGGRIYQNNSTAGRTVFTWDSSDYADGTAFGPNSTFVSQLTLFSDGSFVLGYTGPNYSASTTTVGVGNGGGSGQPATNVDFETLTTPILTGPAVQEFNQPLNLADRNIFFTPQANGGWLVGLTQGSTSAVPEPATWAMMLAGFAFTGAAMRRRKPGVARVGLSYN